MGGSRISGGESTWERHSTAKTIKAAKARLPLCIKSFSRLMWWIRDSPYVGRQRLNSRLAQGAPIRRHFSRFSQGRPAVLDNRQQVGVTHFVEKRSVTKSVCLGGEIVVIRNALRCRFRIVTTGAIEKIG